MLYQKTGCFATQCLVAARGRVKQQHKRQLLSIFVCLVFLATGCKGIKGEVAYEPPGIPLTVSIDTQGQINFSMKGEVKYPTPLGTFSAGVVIDPAKYYQVENTLTIRYDNADYIYDLNGQDFDLKFEEGYYEQINLRKDGSNLFLELRKKSVVGDSPVIPSPTTSNTSVIPSPTQPVLLNTSSSGEPTIGQPWLENSIAFNLERVEVSTDDINVKFYVTNCTFA